MTRRKYNASAKTQERANKLRDLGLLKGLGYTSRNGDVVIKDRAAAQRINRKAKRFFNVIDNPADYAIFTVKKLGKKRASLFQHDANFIAVNKEGYDSVKINKQGNGIIRTMRKSGKKSQEYIMPHLSILRTLEEIADNPLPRGKTLVTVQIEGKGPFAQVKIRDHSSLLAYLSDWNPQKDKDRESLFGKMRIVYWDDAEFEKELEARHLEELKYNSARRRLSRQLKKNKSTRNII